MEETLAYSIEEIILGKENIDENGLLRQTICMVYIPDRNENNEIIDNYKSIEIEKYLQKYNLKEINIDWRYIGGRPVLYVITPKRMSGKELDKIEQSIRDKGVKTFRGGLDSL